jgi:hypothetical protein
VDRNRLIKGQKDEYHGKNQPNLSGITGPAGGFADHLKKSGV